MAEICVIYASEDEATVEKLITLLRKYWEVWWAVDIAQGDWEAAVKKTIRKSKAVLPVISPNIEGKAIFRDELEYASKRGNLIFPFVISRADLPFGFGGLNRTDAFGWTGQINHIGYQQLVNKLSKELGFTDRHDVQLGRQVELNLGRKVIRLPCFIFSLSSYETQLNPKDGIDLFRELCPPAGLVSAYDVWNQRNNRTFMKALDGLTESECAVFMDSGNYEASRKNDQYSKKDNSNGWKKAKFRQVLEQTAPDLVFSFDQPDPRGHQDKATRSIIAGYEREWKVCEKTRAAVCPIVHLPKDARQDPGKFAAQMIVDVASAVDPIMLAIPERELGNGLIARVESVRLIRKALNGTGRYYPLHILGTGNPITMVALAAAGADSFDGLEWCRTVADYTNGHLFHFQQFDLVRESCMSRIRSPLVRQLVEDRNVPYSMQVTSYNLDYFIDWTRTMQDMIHSGQIEHLLKSTIPNIGAELHRRLL